MANSALNTAELKFKLLKLIQDTANLDCNYTKERGAQFVNGLELIITSFVFPVLGVIAIASSFSAAFIQTILTWLTLDKD